MESRRFKSWNKEEDDYLLEKASLGISINSISKKLKRTPKGVSERMYSLGISNRKDNLGMYSINEIAKIIGINNKTVIKWENLGLKIHKKNIGKKKINFITAEDFWKFAKENKELIVFKRIEENSLLPEPEWVKEIRRTERNEVKYKKKWSKEEDERLIKLFKTKTPIKDIVRIMGRNYSAVTHRLSRLRKLQKVNIKWKPVEIEIMYKLEKEGKSDSEIALELGREAIHIRDKRKRLRESGEYKGYRILKNNKLKEVI